MKTSFGTNATTERFLMAICVAFVLAAKGEPLQLVSVPDPAQQPPGGGSGDSVTPIISPEGRYVLFASTANNLVLAGNNGPLAAPFPAKLNVFLRDRAGGTTTLVSRNFAGTGGGNGDSIPVAVSPDGRYALFESNASDLVAGDTNNATDVFLRDLASVSTLLISVSTNGVVGNGASRSAVMTPDGRYVAFVSAASNLVPGDGNGIPDVFVRDLQSGTTMLASVGAVSASLPTDSAIEYSSSELPDISSDGRHVAFYSTATGLVPGVTNVGDIYVRDLVGGTTTWASSSARAAVQSNWGLADAVCFNLALSEGGQFVAYEARPLPLSTSPLAGLILRYHLQDGTTDVVNTNAAVASGPYEDVRSLDITPDGKSVAWIANANVADTCVKVWDAQTSTTTLASGDLSGSVPAGSICEQPVLNPSGRFVAFMSSAPGLVTNALAGDYHLFVRDLQTGATTLVDADSGGVGSGVSAGSVPQLSADGSLVAFECPDGSLAPNDRNHKYDVFLRDLAGGAMELVSAHVAALSSLTPNGSSLLYPPSVSTNGRYVAFASDADNLVSGDTNGCRDVFVCDLVLDTNILVSVGADGSAANALSSEPTLSGDGRHVAFTSGADNLVPGDNNRALDVFVRDLQSGTTVLVSVNSGGSGPGNADSYLPLISSDGKYVLFRSRASNLAAGFFDGENLFVRNMQSGITYALTTTSVACATTTPDGRYTAFTRSGGNVYLWDAQAAATVYTKTTATVYSIGISPDGNRIIYSLYSQLNAVDRAANSSWTISPLGATSRAGLRVSGDSRFLVFTVPYSATNQVYLYDLVARTNLMVSRNYTSGTAAYGASDSPDISSDGRFIAYRSAASNLVPGDTNGLSDVFLYDRSSGVTTLLSANQLCSGAGDNMSLPPVFSPDGQTLVFQSWASDLANGDFNQGADVFAYRLYASGQIPLFQAIIARGTGAAAKPWVIWPVLPGKAYRVQFKNALSDAAWQQLDGSITILGNQAYFNDLSAGAGPRCYRVVGY